MPDEVQYLDIPQLARSFREPLSQWFGSNRRTLPWRTTDRNAYEVWISEVMLQQTRVDQMMPYYNRFLETFPDIISLADAELDEVLLLWEGLGYYTRCRNLHRAARIVRDDYKGIIPSTSGELRGLPGIGKYTAAAIASTVFSEPVAAVDGNIKRVLARVFRVDESVDTAAGMKAIEEHAQTLVDLRNPGEFNEALMELGATVCSPRNPACNQCPLEPICLAASDGVQQDYPKRNPRKRTPHYDVAVAIVIDQDSRMYIQKRPDEGLLGGLWEFPGGKRQKGETLEETCVRELAEETGLEGRIVRNLEPVHHAYSHFKVTIHPFICGIDQTPGSGPPHSRWIAIEDVDSFAFPRANRKIVRQLETILEPPVK